jgi:uncharacterized protein YaeQ
MALGATVHVFDIQLSDVDRGVYESLELRVARHPSESLRYMLTRTLAYCLCLEEGIAFSKGGLSSTDEPPVSIHDPTGILLAWIDVGVPSAERMHKASKSARRTLVFTTEPAQLLREARSKPIHRVETIEAWHIDGELLAALEPFIEKKTSLEIVRNEGRLYVTTGGRVLEGAIGRIPLARE